MKAIWNDVTLAESNKTIIIEGNHYFPPESVHGEYFVDSPTHTTCPWKGFASYKTLRVNGKENQDAAWYYSEPKEAAKEIKGYYAFWKGVEMKEE